MKFYKYPAMVASLACALLPVGCERKPDPAKLAGHNVLIVTLDTTRADRLGCYGYKKAKTPVLDAAAARGTLFEQAFAQVPLTLPSHSSIMTGRYPREHGVRDNARNSLSDAHPTLAAIFKNRGYRTAAFVASFVLDSRFGLDRGFDVYEDDMGEEHKRAQMINWQLPADEITDRALTWLDAKSSDPFFCWVHYYDAHDPYQPPEAFSGPDILPYDGEIAFVDTQVKRLFDWLEKKRLTERTLVIVVGDHGESFGEHEERGHTTFLYETNLRVPMFFIHPNVVPVGKRISEVVEALDVFPTLLDLFGVEVPDDLLSRSLATVFAGGDLDEHAAYGESLYALNSFGWAEQRSLTTGRWKYISSTRPELFDRPADPDERDSVAKENPSVVERMGQDLKDRYEAMTPGEGGVVELSAEDLEALRSLGYMGGASEFSAKEEVFLSQDLRDPKDMLEVLKKLAIARLYMINAKSKTDYAHAILLLTGCTEDSPETMMFRNLLATCYLKAGFPEEALRVAAEALSREEADVTATTLKAEALLGLGRRKEALVECEAAVLKDGGASKTAAQCADILQAHGHTEDAIDFYRQALTDDPQAFRAHSRLCALLNEPEELAEAAEKFREALKTDPTNAEMQHDLGIAYVRLGKAPEALARLREAVRLKPNKCAVVCSLGTALVKVGKPADAKVLFRRAMEIKNCGAEGRYHLGVVLSGEGREDETMRLYEEAIELEPTFVLPIQELSVRYVQLRRLADAIRILEVGVEANPRNVQLATDLAHILAACRDDALRDGAKAVSLAERAAELTNQTDPFVLATLGVAYAEVGDFEKAIEAARRSLELLPSSVPPQINDRIRGQLAGFERGVPYRDPQL